MPNSFQVDTPIGKSIKNLMNAFFTGDSRYKNDYYSSMSGKADAERDLALAKGDDIRDARSARHGFGDVWTKVFRRLSEAQNAPPTLEGSPATPAFSMGDAHGEVAGAVARLGGNAQQIADGFKAAVAALEATAGDPRKALVVQGREPGPDAAFTNAQADAVSARNAGEDIRRALAVENAKPIKLGGNQTAYTREGDVIASGPIVLSEGQSYQTGAESDPVVNVKTSGGSGVPMVSVWDTVNGRQVYIPRTEVNPEIHRADKPLQITSLRPAEVNSGISGALGFPTTDGTIDAEIETGVADAFRAVLQMAINKGLATDAQSGYRVARELMDPYLDIDSRWGRSDVQFKDGLAGDPVSLIADAIRNGATSSPAVAATTGGGAPETPTPNERHIEALRERRNDPRVIDEFNRKFGKGAAARYLGGT